MKFTVSSASLSGKLQALGRVISTKNNITILNCFKFELKGNQLFITAADSENTLTTAIELVENEKDLTFAVNAKTIQDSIKEIPEQPLDFFLNEETQEMTVVYQNGQYKFMTQPADDYPTPPSMDKEGVQSISLSVDKMVSGVNRALFATANDTLRPVMNGVFFDIKEGGVTMVASDGHKMACSRVNEVEAAQEGSFILPQKPAVLMRALFAKEEGNVSVSFNESNAVFTVGQSSLNCRLIEGRYPNYASVIRQDNPNCVTLSRSALLSALRRVLIFSAGSALVKLQVEAGKLTISSQDVDFSMSAEESLLCDYNGSPLCIGFKGTFLTELLQNLECDEVVFQLADASRAGVIVPAVQPEGESILMLLMPMMLNN